MKRSTLLLTALFIQTGAQAAEAVQVITERVAGRAIAVRVALTLPYDRTLPGAPVPLVLRVTNTGQPFTLSRSAQVRATSPSGETFTANWGAEEFGLLQTPTGEPVALSGGATVDVAIPGTDLTNTSWALDPRLSETPGEWRLQVLLFESGREDAAPVVVSAPAQLVIETPREHEIVTWRAIQARNWPQALASIFPDHRDSRYYPYLAALRAHEDYAETARAIAEALARHPDTPIATPLRFSLAHFYSAAANAAFFGERDTEKALHLAAMARAALDDVKESWAASEVQTRIAALPTRDKLTAARKSLDKTQRRQ